MARNGYESHRTNAANVRGRLAFTGVALLLLSLLSGGASATNLAPSWSEFGKVVAVALFVGSMIALTLGMIGDARRHRR